MTQIANGGSAREVFLQIIVFLLAGPIIGALAFCMMVGLSAGNPLYGVFLFSIFLIPPPMIFFTPILYMIAGPAAAITGLIVAMASFWILRPLWLFVFAALVGGAVAAINGLVINATPLIRGWVDLERFNMDLAPLFIVGATSAVICTRLTKSFRVRQMIMIT